jgi:hypothetical protein
VNWDAIGAVGEILGAGAVVATLLYLSVQIRQNSKSLSSSAFITLVENTNRVNSDLANHLGTQISYSKALNDPDACDPAEMATAFWVIRATANNLYLAWALKELDTAKTALWEAALETHLGVFRTRGGRRWFQKNGQAYGNGFFSTVISAIGAEEVVLDLSW